MRSRLVLVAATAMVLGTITAAPAQAAPSAPSVDNIVTATPGLLTADAHTDQPFVAATITGDFADAVVFPVTIGTAPISFDTWGFGAGAKLAVSACESDTPSVETCSEAVAVDFTPTDVEAGITYSADTTVGPGQAFEVTTNDTGGGQLYARWDGAPSGFVSPGLEHVGTEDLATADGFGEGSGTVYVERCNSVHPTFCRPMSTDGVLDSSPLTVRTTSSFTVDPIATVTQFATSQPTLRTTLRGSYVLDYFFEKVGGVTVPGELDVAGTVPSNGEITEAVTVGGELSDGAWEVVVNLTISDPAFGDPLQEVEVRAPFTVDKTGPAATLTPSRTTIHPRISGIAAYPNSVVVTASEGTGITDWVVRRSNAAPGVFVRTFPTTGTSVTWNGKDDGGVVAPQGTYHFHTRDPLGNLSASSATVQVTSKHIVSGSFVREVKAGPTVVDRYVGRCSTLRRPALRGWVGSLGFYANSRCPNTSVDASLVSTVHGLTVPAGYTYTYVRISAYGGAARSHGRSRAVLRYLTDTGKWRYEYLMHPTLGWQNAAVPASANAYVDKNNRLYWGVYTLSGHRYEVAKFKVQLNYRRIVD